MYSLLLVLHSLLRWLVLLSLLYAIFRAIRGYFHRRPFGSADNTIRHWTATFAHIQLTIGFILYFISPLIKSFWSQGLRAGSQLTFFGIIHISMMFGAVVLITIGSAMAKRQLVDNDKFKIMLVYFVLGLLLIFCAIPWPFSPLANRPYFRPF